MPDATLIFEIVRTSAILAGILIAVLTLRTNLRQKALGNAQELVKMFFDKVSEKQLSSWKEVFHGTSDPAGVKEGYMLITPESSGDLSDYWDEPREVSELFIEGPPDSGATMRICNILDMIAYEVNHGAADERFIYFRLGQIMEHCASLISASPELGDSHAALVALAERWLKRKRWKEWPCEVHVYCG